MLEKFRSPELSGENIQLEMFSDRPLRSVPELFVIGENMFAVKFDQFGTVAKNI